MNAGGLITPRCMAISPVRAAPSVAWSVKSKRLDISAYPARRSHQSSCASPPHSLTGSFKGTALELTAEIIVFLCLIATLAGFVDAIAGGGGLLVIQIGRASWRERVCQSV